MLKFFRNLKISRKLNIGFGLLVAITLIVVMLGIIGAQEATEKINTTEELRLPTASVLGQAQVNLLEMQTNVRGYLVLGDRDYRYDYEQAKMDFETNLSQLELLSANWPNEDIQRLEELKTLFAEWSELPEQLFRLHDNSNENQPALPLVRLNYEPVYEASLVVVDELIESRQTQPPDPQNRQLLIDLLNYRTTLETMFTNLLGYATSGDLMFKFAFIRYRQTNTQAWEKLQENRNLLNADEQAKLDALAENRQQLGTLFMDIFDAVDSERAYQDLYLFRTEAVPRTEDMVNILTELNRRQQTLLQNDLSSARNSLADARQQTMIGGMIAIFLGVILAYVFRENIAGPISRLTQTAEQIIAGNLEARATVEFDDEVGWLATTLNAMTHRLIHTIGRLKNRTKELEISERKYRTIFEDSKDTIFITNVDGRIVDVSPACETLLGYSRWELMQYNAITLYANPDDRASFQKLIAEQGVVQDLELKFLRQDGSPIDVTMTATLRQGEDGAILGYQGILRDITLQKEAERERLRALELEKARATAEAANQAKNIFLAKMSHELRTPLNGILGYTQILQQKPNLPADQQRGLTAIKNSGEHLLMLINDILDLARIEAGKIQLHPHAFNLPDFLITVEEMMRPRAETKNLVAARRVESLPETVVGDEMRLRQVLVNLMDNAIKFTQQGSVTLRVEPVEHGFIRFQVTDTGIGIAFDKLDTIFDPFKQLDDENRSQKGTGLGLAISRELVELMGGTLQAESNVGRGSTFWFDLHLPEVKSASSGAAKNQQPVPVIGIKDKSPKILLVDDKVDNREVIKEVLIPLGFSVAEAENGKEALARLKKFKPEAIILDLVMPQMGGLEFIQYARQSKALKAIPIIISSASAYKGDQERSLELGANAFLPKPVNIHRLLEVLQQQLHLEWIYDTGQTDPVPEPEVIPPPAETISDLIKLARIGDIAALQNNADDLSHAPHLKPFITRFRHLTDTFQVNRLISYLESFQDG